MADPITLVTAFNEAINRQDVDMLAALMADDHTFIGSEGERVVGKKAALEAWQTLFVQFPDYQNHFLRMYSDGQRVSVAGHSSCSNVVLTGPALWSVITTDDKLSEWRVYKDTPKNRELLGLAGRSDP